ncbi:MAG TPA: thiamine pyrophosphate-dependent enzyme [Stellaceae bacterium]|nr:thiamine pyrophosphate-dependent enzyme [Stellaceae bacterium]
MRQTRQPGAVARRSFLKGATLVGAAAVAPPLAAAAPVRPAARPALPIQLAAAENREPPREQPLTEGRSGGDFMVDVLKSLDFEYVCANPASSFRGLHESLINYGKNTGPEFITCTHEEAAVAMAHAYAKIEGKPIAVMAHAVVGLQHASMALYNAWCDRAPVFLMVGNSVNAEMRRPGVEWAHTAQDNAVIVRDFVKWDDQPASLQDFAESAVRAYKIAVTPPMGPVVLAIDSELQEGAIEEEAALAIPKLPRSTLPEGDSAAVAETARLLVAAETPVILADRLARTPAGIARLVELAELLQAPVIDQGGRMNFPSRHKLNHSGRARPLISQADVILGLELNDFWGTLHSYRDQLHRSSKLLTRAGVKTVAIGTGDLYLKSNFQNFQRFAEIDLAIAGDGEETLPALIEAAKRLVTDDRRSVFAARGQKLAEARAKLLAADRDDAVYGWDASPISTARLCAELWGQIEKEDWSLVTGTTFTSRWPQRLWAMEKHHHYIGDSGGAGQGYGGGAIVGAALANRKHGRITVAIEGDGDLMYSPGALWTAAHHRIPLLMIVHNNRAYHQEYMHVQRMADRRSRGLDRTWIGTTLREPFIDYAKLAQAMGVYAEGPVSDPQEIGPAIQRALAVVKRGEPALVDAVTQPR